MVPAAPVTSFGPQPPPPRRPGRLERLCERIVGPFLPALALLGALGAMLGSRLFATPGVVIETVTRPGPSQILRSPGATLFIVGQAERGSTTQPIEVRSIREARAKLGPRVTYGVLDDHLATYFAEGGTRAFVGRVVGAAATTGTHTFADRAGAPLPTLKVDASSPGAWSSRITVQIAAGSLPNTFRMIVFLDAAQVEDWNNLASPADAEAKINPAPGNVGSSYIVVDDLASVTAAPTNNPAVIAATALSAGADDRAAIVAADYVAALARFAPALGDGVVIIPGQVAGTTAAGLRAHAAATNRLALTALAAGTTRAAAEAAAITFRGNGGFQEGIGLVWPHVYIDDGAGGRRLISPESYAAGVRARAHVKEGPWRAPAGDLSRAQHVLGVEIDITDAELGSLTEEHVIPIRDFGGAGVQLYGWRSLSTDERNYSLLTGRDVLNRLSVGIKARAAALVFGTIDGQGKFLALLDTECRAEVEPMANAGGLFPRIVDGSQTDPGFVIDTGPAVNTEETLALNEARADVGVRVSPTGETIRVTIAKVAIGTAL